MDVLISNIGSRNLKYRGDFIPNKTFREATKELLEDFSHVREDLEIQILQHHLGPDIEKVYLIASDQGDSKFNFQDTVFSAEILKLLIENGWNIPVEILLFKGNPTDEEKLFSDLGALIRKVLSNHHDDGIILNDAGGTTQMKLVLKTLISYYLEDDQYQIVYSNPADEKRVLDRFYHRKYVLLKTARTFLDRSEYRYALEIVRLVPEQAALNEPIDWWLKFAAKRKRFDREGAKELLKDPEVPKPIRKAKWIQNYCQGKIPDTSIPFLELKDGTRADIFEIASICQLYFEQENYTLGVATYYRLCEEIFQRFAQDNLGYRLNKLSDREKMLESEAAAVSEVFPELRAQYGLPFLVGVATIRADGKMKELLKLLMQTISFFNPQGRQFGLNILRNQSFLAHRNQTITPALIQDHVPAFLDDILPKTFALLQLGDLNIYHQVNGIIDQIFRRE